MTEMHVVGSIVIDSYLLNPSYTPRVKDKLAIAGIPLTSSPKQITDKIVGFISTLEETTFSKLGGGGYNSSKALTYFPGVRITYHDLSRPPEGQKLRKGVNYKFLSFNNVSRALVLGEKNDRVCIKTPRFDRMLELKRKDLEGFIEELESADLVLVNSLSNYSLTEIIGSSPKLREKPRYVVVTKNLPEYQLSRSGMLAEACAVIDIEESEILGCIPDNQGRKSLQEITQALFRLGAHKTVVTMGGEGAAFYEPTQKTIRVVSTTPEVEQEIQKHLSENGVLKNGAGDYFVAALSMYARENNLEDSVRLAQMFVIKNLLKYNNIKEEDFISKAA